ncbi:MAG: hypothetical protein ACTSRO_04095, partial [Candidatus Heimdallarchaeaceae archaeon]
NNPSQLGDPCFKMVVTDLHKTSQPIIRYELNDIITISPERCSCGSSFRVIEKVMGRTNDLFWAENKLTGELQFIFPDYIKRAIISSSEEIEEYQVIQKSFRSILVKLVVKTENRKEKLVAVVQRNIEAVFTSYNCEEPNVEIVFEKTLLENTSSKLIRIKRDFVVNE